MLGLEHAPHRTALYRTRKMLSETYMEKFNRKFLERLKSSGKVGVNATGLRQSTRDCPWSSTKEDGRRDYIKLSRRNCRLIAEKGGQAYIKPKKNSLVKAKDCWPWKQMITLFKEHPRTFKRFYMLRQRVEAGWHSLKSLVGDLVRNRTNKTINAEIWSKITCYNLIWTIRGSHKF